MHSKASPRGLPRDPEPSRRLTCLQRELTSAPGPCRVHLQVSSNFDSGWVDDKVDGQPPAWQVVDHSLIETAKREDPDDPPSSDDIRREKMKGIGTGIDNIPKMIMVYFSPWSVTARSTTVLPVVFLP